MLMRVRKNIADLPDPHDINCTGEMKMLAGQVVDVHRLRGFSVIGGAVYNNRLGMTWVWDNDWLEPMHEFANEEDV